MGVGGNGRTDLSAAALFAIVWAELAETLGTAAVAAIVRRAVGRAAAESPELAELVVSRENLEYSYALPRAWSHTAEDVPPALRALVAEIGRLLVELTGTVVTSRLAQIPELRASGLLWRAEDAN